MDFKYSKFYVVDGSVFGCLNFLWAITGIDVHAKERERECEKSCEYKQQKRK